MVRVSSNTGTYTVSLYTRNTADGAATVRHYQIKETNGSPKQFYLAEKYIFNSIPELIEYHKHNAAGLVSRLRHPVGDQTREAPKTAGFSYDKWEINPHIYSVMKTCWMEKPDERPSFTELSLMITDELEADGPAS
ncbi:tyrosine-protein kinase Tec-like [Sinocyclocheilus grahami]|uniref:tyrosine-protein kinase Tec-like n=1 Tax=Sinocyclocheilus grahami TaxID=75366 RepID=UPI0007ACE225|nr:PREDICTED: tyrosine-protein kinase Tec-like [Sinocyclocheilus grahami]